MWSREPGASPPCPRGAASADKIIDACRRSGEVTVELWVQPESFKRARSDVQSANLIAIENPPTGAMLPRRSM